MKKRDAILLTIFCCLITAVITLQATLLFGGGLMANKKAVPVDAGSDYADDTYLTKETLDRLAELASVYGEYYVGDFDHKAFENALLGSFAGGVGDEFGQYFSKEEFAQYIEDYNGEYCGIGVSVIFNAQYYGLEVLNVYAGSPADKAGMLPGDLITAVEGQSILDIGYYGAIDLVKGEEGTQVSMTIRRGRDFEQSLEMKMIRAKLEEITVTWKIYAKASDVAVVNITGFDAKTPYQFEKCVNEAIRAGVKGIVFDVRNNPGGNLDAICSILDALLPEGPIIRIDYKGEENDTHIDSDADCLDMPMVVLCNENTASAAELFTSALKDYNIAKVVGMKTFGKGTMQSIFELSDGRGVSVTSAYYLPPFSDNYHHKGITPDVIVELPDDLKNVNLYKLTDEEDVQMQAAVVTLIESMQAKEKGLKT